MGSKSSTTRVSPYKGAQPGINRTANLALNALNRGDLAPANPQWSQATQDGRSAIMGTARNNPITAAATGSLGDLLGAPRFQGSGSYGPINAYGASAMRPAAGFDQGSYGPIDAYGAQGYGQPVTPYGLSSFGALADNAGVDAVRQSITDQVERSVKDSFATGGGLYNSTGARQAMASGITNALAPFEYGQINRNQDINRDQFNQEQARGMQNYYTATGMDQAQFNADQARMMQDYYAAEGMNQDQFNREQALGLQNYFATEGMNQSRFNEGQARLMQDYYTSLGMDVGQFNTEADRAYQQYLGDAGLQLSALGLSPAISGLQYQDGQALLGMGQLRDQYRAANQNQTRDNLLTATNIFGSLGGLGSTTTAPTGQSLGGQVVGGGLGALGTYGALSANPATAPFALAGAGLAGLSALF